jgi:hypothetical protein
VRLGLTKTGLQVGVGWLILAKHSQHPKAYLCGALGMMALSVADAAHNAHVLKGR